MHALVYQELIINFAIVAHSKLVECFLAIIIQLSCENLELGDFIF